MRDIIIFASGIIIGAALMIERVSRSRRPYIIVERISDDDGKKETEKKEDQPNENKENKEEQQPSAGAGTLEELKDKVREVAGLKKDTADDESSTPDKM